MSPEPPLPPALVVVIAIGNEYRRDDGAGAAVAAQVARRDPSVRNVGAAVDPLDLLGRWDGADLAVVIDAVRSSEPVGSVLVLELGPEAGRSAGAAAGGGRATSSHGVDVGGALRIARALGHAPARVVLVGIVGGDFGSGPGLSPAVEAAVPAAVDAVLHLTREARACA